MAALSGTGVIVHKESRFAIICCKDFGQVFLSCDGWKGTQTFKEIHEGNWVDFIAKNQQQYKGCRWMASNAREGTFTWQFRMSGTSGTMLVLENIDAMVTHVADDFLILWSDIFGRIVVEKDITVRYLLSGKLVLFDSVLVSVRRLKKGELRDVSWKACSIKKLTDSKTKSSFIEVEAQLTELNSSDRSAILSAPGYPGISTTFLDYVQHCPNVQDFLETMSVVEKFRVLIVPDVKNSQYQWRAIFVEPLVKKLAAIPKPAANDREMDFGLQLDAELNEMECDLLPIDDKIIDLLQTISVSKEKSRETIVIEEHKSLKLPRTKECEVQTGSLEEWDCLSRFCQDPKLYSLIREKHIELVRPIKMVITGKHRHINSVSWCSDTKSSVEVDQRNERFVNASVQTGDLLETEIISKLVQDKEIDSYMEEHHEQLWTRMYLNLNE